MADYPPPLTPILQICEIFSHHVAQKVVYYPNTFGKVGSSKRKNMADKTALQVDTEIAHLIHNAYKRTQNLLHTYRKELDTLAKGLIEYETLSGDEVKLLLSGKKIGKEEKMKRPTSTKTSVPEVN